MNQLPKTPRIGAALAAAVLLTLLAGCGTDDGNDTGAAIPTSSAADRCPYATDAEFSAAIGANVVSSVAQDTSYGKSCEYQYTPDDDGGTGLVQIEVYDRAVAYDRRLTDQCRPSEYSSKEPIPGIGLEAYLCSPDLLVRVSASRGFVVYLQCCAAKDDAIEAVAALVAPRIEAG